MKNFLIAWFVSIAFCCSVVQAQSVSSTAPVVTSTQYVTSSSPLSDGRTVTTYYSPQSPSPITSIRPFGSISPVSRTSSRVVYQPTALTTINGSQVTPDPYYGGASVAPTITSQPIADGCCQPCECQPLTSVGFAPTTTIGYQQYPTTAAYPIAQSGYSYRPVNTALPTQANGTYVGRGLIGQPKAYVDGQPLRNFFRFLTP